MELGIKYDEVSKTVTNPVKQNEGAMFGWIRRHWATKMVAKDAEKLMRTKGQRAFHEAREMSRLAWRKGDVQAAEHWAKVTLAVAKSYRGKAELGIASQEMS